MFPVCFVCSYKFGFYLLRFLICLTYGCFCVLLEFPGLLWVQCFLDFLLLAGDLMGIWFCIDLDLRSHLCDLTDLCFG